MTDLHTHILPGVDDGPSEQATALKMLSIQLNSGVDRVMFTPHFNCQAEDVEKFVERRDLAVSQLEAGLKGTAIPEIKVGAEVAYSAELVSDRLIERLDLLTMGGSRYLLLELPYIMYPVFVEQVTDTLLDKGIVPVFAHIERYAYFHSRPDLLYRLVGAGALAQINIQALMDKRGSNFPAACLSKSLAHFVASDTHDIKLRPPVLAEIKALLAPDIVDMLEANALAVWNDVPLSVCAPSQIKRNIFGKYI